MARYNFTGMTDQDLPLCKGDVLTIIGVTKVNVVTILVLMLLTLLCSQSPSLQDLLLVFFSKFQINKRILYFTGPKLVQSQKYSGTRGNHPSKLCPEERRGKVRRKAQPHAVSTVLVTWSKVCVYTPISQNSKITDR